MVALTSTLIDLFLQVGILCVLAASMALLKMKKIHMHANVMLSAVVLNVISFIAVMGPRWDNIGEGGTGTMGTLATAHVATGGLAFLLSFFLMGSWLLTSLFFQTAAAPKFLRCYGQKTLMWATLTLWIVSLVLGIVLYFTVNTTLLGNFPISLGGGN